MVVYPGWDNYLFTEHKLVAVNPFTSAGELGLLKVLTKRGTYGFVNRGPILEDTGSLSGLAKSKPSSGAEGAAPSAQTSDPEAMLQATQSTDKKDVHTTFKATSRITASILTYFKGEATIADRNTTLNIESITAEYINQDDLVKLVNEGRWKPDPQKSQFPKDW